MHDMAKKLSVRELRQSLGFTREQFAKKAGVDATTISRWEVHGVPKQGTARLVVEQIAREAGVPVT